MKFNHCKKRIILCSTLGILLFGVLFLSIDFNGYDTHSKSIPCSDTGIIFSITTYDGVSESQPFVKCLGHTWLSVDNQTGHSVYLKGQEIANGETVTFSIWAISGHFGVVYNLEPAFIQDCGRYEGRQSLSINIDEKQLCVIEEYIDRNDAWTLGRNCSRWSIDLWNALVNEEYRLKSQTLIYTPTRLQKAFDEFDCIKMNKDFLHTDGIFFFREDERVELELCL